MKIKWAKEIEDGLMGRGRLIGALGQRDQAREVHLQEREIFWEKT